MGKEQFKEERGHFWGDDEMGFKKIHRGKPSSLRVLCKISALWTLQYLIRAGSNGHRPQGRRVTVLRRKRTSS